MKVNFLIGLLVSVWLLMLGCSRNRNPVESQTDDQISVSTFQSPCKDVIQAKPTVGDPVIIALEGNDIVVTHRDAFYNCCSEIVVDVQREGFDIAIYEADTALVLCNCLCYFDIITTIYGLSPGTYAISVFDIFGNYVGGGEAIIPPGGRVRNIGRSRDWGEDMSWLVGEDATIPGRQLGKGTVDSFSFEQSPCHPPTSVVVDGIVAEVHDGVLLVTHIDAIYNCAARVKARPKQFGNILDLVEVVTNPEEKVRCWCPFDIVTTVVGLSPGRYLVRVWDEDKAVLFGEVTVEI